MVLFAFLTFGVMLWLNIVKGVFVHQAREGTSNRTCRKQSRIQVDQSFELTNVTKFKDPELQQLTQDVTAHLRHHAKTS